MDNLERKVTKIGNSYGITFPLELLKEAGISYGDNVRLELKDGKIVLYKKEEVRLPEGVDNDFMDVLNDVIKEHDVAFKGLVDK
ncbi:AbrB/MazE/SpoVT family DNA-binding domain-containing protein [Virgibacillus necropolis]|uniref:AbrB family transcriptional regulator n=1 Tax=Virgibacillus necropolis TaxID=163877 RepID=A0A221MGK1_9BACI|nr:AbrB/MazE/SpoVT family DNA-binding domain-containing protein [Virgibacillus necropolis]ASN06777.1 AbrB family transcriptional regulator [Virgibacillus necropolis]